MEQMSFYCENEHLFAILGYDPVLLFMSDVELTCPICQTDSVKPKEVFSPSL